MKSDTQNMLNFDHVEECNEIQVESSSGWKLHRFLLIRDSKSKIVLWRKKISCTFFAIPHESGTFSLENKKYAYGTAQTVTFTPNSDYEFIQWSDGNTQLTRSFVVSSIPYELYALCKKRTSSEYIDYFDSTEEFPTLTTISTLKQFKAGRYFCHIIGSGGNYNCQWSGSTINFLFLGAQATGGSGACLTCDFNVSIDGDLCKIDCGTFDTPSEFINQTHEIHFKLACGTSGTAPQALTIQKGYAGTIADSIIVGDIVQTRSTADGFDGGQASEPYISQYVGPWYPTVDGAKYANDIYPYGGGASANGESHNTKGHVHIERYCEVIFVDSDGSILKEKQYVRKGQNAIPPEDPIRSRKKFISWTPDYTNVTTDLICVAQYQTTYTYAWTGYINGGNNESHQQMVKQQINLLRSQGYVHLGDPKWSQFRYDSTQLLAAVGQLGLLGQQYLNSNMVDTNNPCKYMMENMGGEENGGNQLIWTVPR